MIPLVEKIEHDGKDGGYTVKFSPKMEEVGTQVVTVHARPAPEETRTENNSRPAAINVAKASGRRTRAVLNGNMSTSPGVEV